MLRGIDEAARGMGHAQGSEVLVTNFVRELVEGKEYLFSDQGEADFKGFDQSVRLFEVRWDIDRRHAHPPVAPSG